MERPLLRYSIAVFVGLRKVISGIEKQHRKVRYSLPKKMRHYHVFRLKAAGQERACALVGLEHDFEGLLGRKTFQFLSDAIHFHLIGLFLIALWLCEPQGIRQRQSASKGFFIGGV